MLATKIDIREELDRLAGGPLLSGNTAGARKSRDLRPRNLKEPPRNPPRWRLDMAAMQESVAVCGDIRSRSDVQSFLRKVKKSLVTPSILHYSSRPNLTKPMEKLMIRHVLNKLGFVRSTLAVGVGIPLLMASAYAQGNAPGTTRASTGVATSEQHRRRGSIDRTSHRDGFIHSDCGDRVCSAGYRLHG